jgi:transglutaminase-like putative cysteine protease
LKKLVIFCFCIVGFIYLSNKNVVPSINQIEIFLFQFPRQVSQDIISLSQQLKLTKQETATQQPKQVIANTKPNPVRTSTVSNEKYPPTVIQTYRVTFDKGILVVTGKPTPYGQFNKATGVILDIQEPRSNSRTTIKVPFTNGAIHYEYRLHYSVGEIILNLNETYKGKTNDPNKVLGYADYHLTDGDPYLLPSFMVQSDNPTLINLAQSITKGKQTNVDKSRAIFEWVAKNVSYNYRLVNSPKPPFYSALQTYQTRNVLCSGYADLSAALHRAVGIEAKVKYGGNHAWNEINLNGNWQPEDPTYGSGFIDLNTGKFVHSYHPAYFFKTDKHTKGEYPW